MGQRLRRNITLSLIATLALTLVSAQASWRSKSSLRYKTFFGKCPSRVAGALALKLMKTFEETASLRDVKLKIVEEKLKEKHFLSDYRITFDPLTNLINFNFECPEPLMKVQIYKESGLESYEALLVETGELFDPTYEVLLKAEGKLATQLPYLALPVGEMSSALQKRITSIVSSMAPEFRKKLSEVILKEGGELTIILSVAGSPSSVFMGDDLWEDKLVRLEKIISYMEAKKKVPAIINLTNAKKVVVKFNDKI
jgi:hypothetical protein